MEEGKEDEEEEEDKVESIFEKEAEVSEHEGLLNRMDEKTDEERLRYHKNFLGQWEMVKQLENELGLHGKYIICK